MTLHLSAPWCKSPTQTVNYASCHDNMTLYDRLTVSCPDAGTEDWIRMNNLAAAIYMTSQGVPFIHAGEEMLRSNPLPALLGAMCAGLLAGVLVYKKKK